MSTFVCDLVLVIRRNVDPIGPLRPPWYDRDIEDILEILRAHGMGSILDGPTKRRPIEPGDDATVVLTVRHALPMKDVGEQILTQELTGCGVEDPPRCIAASVSRFGWKSLTYERLATMRPCRFTRTPKHIQELVTRVLEGNIYAPSE